VISPAVAQAHTPLVLLTVASVLLWGWATLVDAFSLLTQPTDAPMGVCERGGSCFRPAAGSESKTGLREIPHGVLVRMPCLPTVTMTRSCRHTDTIVWNPELDTPSLLRRDTIVPPRGPRGEYA
jgi:hypothetical protein